jgi:hypothetical protein
VKAASGGWVRAVAALPIVLGAFGCAADDKVVRVIDGRPVAGDFVPAEAYSAYLRGAIADAAGDLNAAIEAYGIAVTLGPLDPEPLARLGDARCRRDPRDPRAADAFHKALSIDEAYAPALEAMARCAERRHEPRTAVEVGVLASKADPGDAAPLATLARLEQAEAGPRSEELRARLVAMTIADGTNEVAWRALASWARAHGDGILEARALAHVAPSTEAKLRELGLALSRLRGEGNVVAARSLARSLALASPAGTVDAGTARLAIDDALLAGDADAARRIATRAGVPTAVVAARALLWGDPVSARAMARELSAADPRALGPLLLRAAAADPAVYPKGAPLAGPSTDGAIPAEVWLAYASALARAGSPTATRAALQAIARAPILPGDELVTPIAVALSAAGVIDVKELDPDGRIELAERRAETTPDEVIAKADDRHRLLALARRAPRDLATVALARSLSRMRARDSIVAVAFARLALAGAIDVAPHAMDALLSGLDPADPLVAGAALDCAVRSGDTSAIPLARARLAAVAHTDAERARVE